MSLIEIETKLQTTDREGVKSVLESKINDGMTPRNVVDYVGLAVSNLDNRLNEIKEAEAQLKQLKKEVQTQQEIIKVGVSDWLTENGIDRLGGNILSSISVFEPKEKTTVIIDNEEALINAGYFKAALDKTEVKNAILNGVELEGAHLEIEHQEPTIKINKKRNATAISKD